MSKISRYFIIIVCIGAIGWIAYLSYKEEHKIFDLRSEIEIDYSQYANVDEMVIAGKNIFFSGIDEMSQGSDTEKAGLKKIISARNLFKEVLKKNELHPEGLAYWAITNGILADHENDMMIKMEMMNTAFSLLDRALKLQNDLFYGYFYRGIFSVEVPDTIFHRLEQGVVDLELVLKKNKESAFLKRDDYEALLFYLGKGRILQGEPDGYQYLKTLNQETSNHQLKKISQELINGAR